MAHLDRRRTDKSILRRLYLAMTPEIQIIGFIVLCTFIFTMSYSKFDAYGSVLDDHEQRIRKIEHVEESIQEIKDYLGIPKRGR